MGKTKLKNNIDMTQPSLKTLIMQKFIPMDFCISSIIRENKFHRRNYPDQPIKGTSALSFRNRKAFALQGSMTVEAAIVLPLFLFFFLNLLWIMEIYNLQSTLQMALRECGNEICIYAHAYDRLVDEEEDSGLEALLENISFSYLFVKGYVEDYAGAEFLENAPVTGGKDGLIYADSSILQKDDVVDLVVSYRAEPFISIAGFTRAFFYVRYYARAWTGYDVTAPKEGGDEISVYVAENAKVWHWDKECSHIRLDIRVCEFDALDKLRNTYGECYKECELCVAGQSDSVYITPDGNRYHYSGICRGLRRTIYIMTLSRAEELYRECSRCESRYGSGR